MAHTRVTHSMRIELLDSPGDSSYLLDPEFLGCPKNEYFDCHDLRIPPEGVESPGLLVLVNLSDDDVTAETSIFAGLPAYGTIATRSVNFKNQAAVVG